MTEMKRKRKHSISQLDGELFVSVSLLLYLNLLLGAVAVPKWIGKSRVVKTLWIGSDRRKLHNN